MINPMQSSTLMEKKKTLREREFITASKAHVFLSYVSACTTDWGQNTGLEKTEQDNPQPNNETQRPRSKSEKDKYKKVREIVKPSLKKCGLELEVMQDFAITMGIQQGYLQK